MKTDFGPLSPGRGCRRAPQCNLAFTLLELLVAAAITAVLVGFIVAVVANVSGFWTRSSGRITAEAQARFVLDRLALDLQSAIYRDDGQVWLAADVLFDPTNSGLWRDSGGVTKPAAATAPLRYDAPAIADAVFGQAGTWLRFFTASRGQLANGTETSAPVAVAWQLVRRATTSRAGPEDARYLLFRAQVRPDHALDAGFDITAAPYATTNPAPIYGEPHTIRSPALDSLMAENVIDFGVRLYARDASGALRQIFPSVEATSHRASLPAGMGAPNAQFPESAELMIRVLSDEGARLIAAFESNPPRITRPPGSASDAEYWWTLALAHSHVFTRRVALAAQSH